MFFRKFERRTSSSSSRAAEDWHPTPEWVASWKNKLPLHTVMRLLQVSAEFWHPTPEWVASWKNKLSLHTVMRLLQVSTEDWHPTPEWVASWKNKLSLHTAMRLLQVSADWGGSKQGRITKCSSSKAATAGRSRNCLCTLSWDRLVETKKGVERRREHFSNGTLLFCTLLWDWCR